MTEEPRSSGLVAFWEKGLIQKIYSPQTAGGGVKTKGLPIYTCLAFDHSYGDKINFRSQSEILKMDRFGVLPGVLPASFNSHFLVGKRKIRSLNQLVVGQML